MFLVNCCYWCLLAMVVRSKMCRVCGSSLNKSNRSFDSCLCKACFKADMAKLKAEDLAEDSMTNEERLADFLG